MKRRFSSFFYGPRCILSVALTLAIWVVYSRNGLQYNVLSIKHTITSRYMCSKRTYGVKRTSFECLKNVPKDFTMKKWRSCDKSYLCTPSIASTSSSLQPFSIFASLTYSTSSSNQTGSLMSGTNHHTTTPQNYTMRRTGKIWPLITVRGENQKNDGSYYFKEMFMSDHKSITLIWFIFSNN